MGDSNPQRPEKLTGSLADHISPVRFSLIMHNRSHADFDLMPETKDETAAMRAVQPVRSDLRCTG